MGYILEIKPSCQQQIDKSCKRNLLLRKVLERKIAEILVNPEHYKPLRYNLAGERRVHILKSFVLVFEIDHNKRIVALLRFRHHDEAYRR